MSWNDIWICDSDNLTWDQDNEAADKMNKDSWNMFFCLNFYTLCILFHMRLQRTSKQMRKEREKIKKQTV